MPQSVTPSGDSAPRGPPKRPGAAVPYSPAAAFAAMSVRWCAPSSAIRSTER